MLQNAFKLELRYQVRLLIRRVFRLGVWGGIFTLVLWGLKARSTEFIDRSGDKFPRPINSSTVFFNSAEEFPKCNEVNKNRIAMINSEVSSDKPNAPLFHHCDGKIWVTNYEPAGDFDVQIVCGKPAYPQGEIPGAAFVFLKSAKWGEAIICSEFSSKSIIIERGYLNLNGKPSFKFGSDSLGTYFECAPDSKSDRMIRIYEKFCDLAE